MSAAADVAQATIAANFAGSRSRRGILWTKINVTTAKKRLFITTSQRMISDVLPITFVLLGQIGPVTVVVIEH
jgi:hypothetical protein